MKPEYVEEYLEGVLVEAQKRFSSVVDAWYSLCDPFFYHDVLDGLDSICTEYRNRLFGLRQYMISADAPVSVGVSIEQAQHSVLVLFSTAMDSALQHQKELIKLCSVSAEFSPTSEAVETVLLPPENPDLELPVEPHDAVVSLIDCHVCNGLGVLSSGDFEDDSATENCQHCSSSGFEPESEILPFSPFPSTPTGSKRHYFQNITFIPRWIKRHSWSLKARRFKYLIIYGKSRELVNV